MYRPNWAESEITGARTAIPALGFPVLDAEDPPEPPPEEEPPEEPPPEDPPFAAPPAETPPVAADEADDITAEHVLAADGF